MVLREKHILKPHKESFYNFLAFIIPISYYGFFISLTPGYVDSCLVLHNAYNLNLSSWVNNHNLFSLAGYILMQIFNGANEFAVVNIFSMVCGAGTVFFTYLLCKRITDSHLIGAVSAAAIMISHSLTWHSTMLEVYTLNSVLMMSFLYCFYCYYEKRRIVYAYTGAFLWGLGISNHILMGLFVFSIVFFIAESIRSLTIKNILIGIFLFLVGLSPFLIILIKDWIISGSLVGIMSKNTGGDFRSLMFSTNRFWFWKRNYFIFFLYQFAIPIVFFGIWGFKSLFNKKPFAVFFLLSFFAQLLWSSNYHIWDSFAFSLPVYVMFSVPVALGLRSIKGKQSKVFFYGAIIVFSLFQLFLYRRIDKIKIVNDYIREYPMVEMVGVRFDPVKYFLNPWKRGFTRVDNYISEFSKKMPEDSIVFDNIYDYPFVYYYQDIRDERTDILSPIIFAFWVRQKDIVKWSGRINSITSSGRDVYMSQFVFDTLNHKLIYDNKEIVHITVDDYLYKIERDFDG